MQRDLLTRLSAVVMLAGTALATAPACGRLPFAVPRGDGGLGDGDADVHPDVNADVAPPCVPLDGGSPSDAETADAPRETIYVKASNTDEVDEFGLQVAISSDWLVVGTMLEDSAAVGVNGDALDDSATSSGAVYVFGRMGDTWIQRAYLKANNTGAYDQFGAGVAVSGNTVVVGARSESSNATGVNGDGSNEGASNSGAAYVFSEAGGDWTQEAYLKASNTDRNDQFGWSVAISGDTIVVGAADEASSATGVDGDADDDGAPGSGAAYVFERVAGVWSQTAYLKADNSEAADRFGTSVAVSGDTIVVGAPGEDSAATSGGDDNSAADSGAAYAFRRVGGIWRAAGRLKALNADRLDVFGSSVAVSGDVVAVGALQEASAAVGVDGDPENDGADGAGAVYLFARTDDGFFLSAYVKASNTHEIDQFGTSVALSGDVLAVGAPFEDSRAIGINGDHCDDRAESSGAVYVFTRRGGRWLQDAYVKASNTGFNDRLGVSVGFSDGTLVVGAPGEDSALTGVGGNGTDDSVMQAGAAYVIRLPRWSGP
jgi:hypothetical protein